MANRQFLSEPIPRDHTPSRPNRRAAISTITNHTTDHFDVYLSWLTSLSTSSQILASSVLPFLRWRGALRSIAPRAILYTSARTGGSHRYSREWQNLSSACPVHYSATGDARALGRRAGAKVCPASRQTARPQSRMASCKLVCKTVRSRSSSLARPRPLPCSRLRLHAARRSKNARSKSTGSNFGSPWI